MRSIHAFFVLLGIAVLLCFVSQASYTAEFSLPVGGDWYSWEKVIAPAVADNSFHWGVDIAAGEAKGKEC